MIRPVFASLENDLDCVLRRSRLFADRHLSVDVIINVQAGAISSDKRAIATVDALDRLTEGIVGPVRGADSIAIRFHYTHYVGHAGEITRELLGAKQPDVHLIVSAGGDGTHAEVLAAFEAAETSSAAPGGERYFIRLPLGTGNDGADAPDLPRAVRLLLGCAEQRRAGQIDVMPVGMPVFRGYNIASIGLDAYVAYLTNRLKRRFGGDLYRLIADVMTLLYERVVGAGRMVVDLVDERSRAERLEGTFLLLAMGVSGYRRYGGGKQVLPGYENLCAVERLGVIGKIRLKPLFYRGEHVHEPNVVMRSARRITVSYDRPIPLQIDGETVWLTAESFPLEMHVQAPRVPVLSFPLGAGGAASIPAGELDPPQSNV
ncbi:MAG: diacylglycerol/lipid kinase family protein [bacterium]